LDEDPNNWDHEFDPDFDDFDDDDDDDESCASFAFDGHLDDDGFDFHAEYDF